MTACWQQWRYQILAVFLEETASGKWLDSAAAGR